MRAFLAAVAFLAAAGPVHAQPQAQTPADRPDAPVAASRPAASRSITALDLSGVLAALQGAGFTGEIKAEGQGAYVLARMDATPFQVFLGDCQPTGGRCADLELYAGFTGTPRLPLARINGWNARTRYARAFLDEKGNPALQMDVSLRGGVTQENLKATLETWGAALETYALFLVARVPPVGAVAAPGDAQRPAAPPIGGDPSR
ncbi:MAG: YbjN domain-containing protein [Hyphomonadaceae bacterium]|nr:YbjN domain-containing protein [Hyphomonadaceae bacterium]